MTYQDAALRGPKVDHQEKVFLLLLLVHLGTSGKGVPARERKCRRDGISCEGSVVAACRAAWNDNHIYQGYMANIHFDAECTKDLR